MAKLLDDLKGLSEAFTSINTPRHAAMVDRAHNRIIELEYALADMLGGWKYIREQHGDLRGVGWDRCQQAAEALLPDAAEVLRRRQA